MKKLIFVLLTLLSLSGYLMGQWTQGSGIDGGDFRCLAKVGSDIYAGSDYGGVFRSSDNGDNWTALLNGLPAIYSISNIIDNGTILFAGTNGSGIYRSDDNGATWAQKNNGIQINPEPNSWDFYTTGFAKTTGYIYASMRINGIYKSGNNGDEWVRIFDPYNQDSSVYREIYTLCSIGDVLFAGGTTEGGILRSADQGSTWELISAGFPSGGVIVHQLFSSGVNLYARTSHGFYWSPSNGDYWISINSGITDPTAAYFGALSIDGNIMYASTNGSSTEPPKTYKSINGGLEWTNIPALSTSYFVMALLNSGNNVFAGHVGSYDMSSNGGGVVRSTDGGETWSPANNGLSSIHCKALTSNGNDVFAGTSYYSGIYKSSDNGNTWAKSLLPGTTTNYQLLSILSVGSVIYAGNSSKTSSGGVFKSTDNGQNWTATASIDKAVYVLGANTTYLFAGTLNTGMRRSSDGGTTWTTINTGLNTINQKSIRAIAVNGSKIYIGTNNGVFRSTNDGTNWTAANGGIGSPGYSSVNSLVVKGDTILAGNKRTFNNGVTWSWLSNAPGVIYALLLDGSTIYSGGSMGVHVSIDWGDTWTSLNETFPMIPMVYSLYKLNNKLYAGTYGQSVWSYELNGAAPIAFNVVGSGSYCQGSGGLEVSLDGSETGVTYTLYKNAVAQEPTVVGTGSPISFGMQTAGSYTVEGTNSSGTTVMTGNAMITEILPLPVGVTITSDQNNVCPGISVTFTATPENGGTPSYQWFINSVAVGDDEAQYSYIPENDDEIYVEMTSSLDCVTNNPASSNIIVMIVGDEELPTISCVGSQTVEANSGNSYIVSGTEFDPIETGDNCSIASVINDFNSLETLAGAAFPIGTTTVIWIIIDGSGNQATCSFEVTVNTLPCLSPWSYAVTGSQHIIIIPVDAAPEIFGEPLAPFDWIGVFFLNDDGEETCGGAIQWTGTGNVGFMAYADDPTTTEKDGFDAGESFRWKMSRCGDPEEFTAIATYDPNQPSQGNFQSFGISLLTSLKAAYIQYFMLNQGWNSMSSYIVPFNLPVEDLFAPIVGNLTILSNLTTMYWPQQGVNTIGNWNSNSGYVAKLTAETDFMIAGENYAAGTMTVPAGWSYLPVLSECPADVMEVFGGNLANVVIIQELIGTGVFWPAFEINTIGNFQPGKAYAIKLLNPVDVTFPDCDQKSSTQPTSGINKIGTVWGELNYSPNIQVTAILKSALSDLQSGDLVGAFNADGLLCGYLEIGAVEHNLAITLFGNDQMTNTTTGLINGEPIFFKLFRSLSGELFDLEVEYDSSLENSTGNYHTGTFAAITDLTLNSTGMNEMNSVKYSIMPNPAKESITITAAHGAGHYVEAMIYDMHGTLLIENSFQKQTSMNIGYLNPGVYMVVLRTAYSYEVQKLIVR